MKTEKLLTYGLYGLALGAVAYLGYTFWVKSQTPVYVAPAQPVTPAPAPQTSSGNGFSVGNAINPLIPLSPLQNTGLNFIDPSTTQSDSSGGFGVKYTIPGV